MKKFTLAILTFGILLLFSAYGVLVTLSESREYGRISLEYYLLTPKELAKISEHCEDDPRFIYSSADGPKPAIIHLYCVYEQSAINDYMEESSFEKVSMNRFKKGTMEIEFEKNDGNKVAFTTVYEYL